VNDIIQNISTLLSSQWSTDQFLSTCSRWPLKYALSVWSSRLKIVPFLFSYRAQCTCACHKDTSGDGGIAPLILNLDTRWTWVVSFTPQTRNTSGISPRHLQNNTLERAPAPIWKLRRKSLVLVGNRTTFSWSPAGSPIGIPTTLSQLPPCTYTEKSADCPKLPPRFCSRGNGTQPFPSRNSPGKGSRGKGSRVFLAPWQLHDCHDDCFLHWLAGIHCSHWKPRLHVSRFEFEMKISPPHLQLIVTYKRDHWC
jgi:hypothetical protein